MKKVVEGEYDPFESIESAMNLDVRDWSENKTDAWLYAIIVGWDECLSEIANTYQFDMARLQKLRANYLKNKPENQ